jgi:tRNA threonylcarbamoyl adenosine modification protein YeaZ
MLILACDTTSEAGGVGIYQDHECLALIASDGPANRYAVSLFHLLDRAIEEAKAQFGAPLRGLADIELIAVAIGPGSFTGIRVGLAAAQAWARAFRLPVQGVSVLEALALASEAETPWAVPLLDAHRGEFYAGFFPVGPQSGAPAAWRESRAAGGWILRPAELGPLFAHCLPPGAEGTCVARECDPAALAVRESLSGSFRWKTVPCTLLGAVASLGLRNYLSQAHQAAGHLDACYIRRPDAEAHWKG